MPHYIIPANCVNTTSPKNIMELTFALWSGQQCYGVDIWGSKIIHNYLLICDTFAFMTIIGQQNKLSRLELVKK